MNSKIPVNSIKKIAEFFRISSTNEKLEDLERRLVLNPQDISIRREYLRLCDRLSESPEAYIKWVEDTYGFTFNSNEYTLGGAIDDLRWMAGVTFPNLEGMAYDYSRLSSLEGLGEAITPNLEYMNFSNNQLTSIDELATMTLGKVHTLDFQKNEISKIPSGIDAPNLINFVLTSNQLSSIHDFSRMTSGTLETLNLEDNKITSLEGIYEWVFPSLDYLYLGKNPLQNAKSVAENLMRLVRGRTRPLFVSLKGVGVRDSVRSIINRNLDDRELDSRFGRKIVITL